jgi:aryl-alcohol dehydrogenase-like predicted oxidoreductase
VNVPKRRIGQSDLMVSALGLGCWQFSGGHGLVGRFWPALSEDVIDDIVAKSLSGGINWFDTAEVYGHGASERALARALQRAKADPASVIVATKWWPVLKSARSITSSIDERIDALSPYPIALYQVHQPYSLSSIRGEMNAMAELVERADIRYVGVSNFSARQMAVADEALRRRGIKLISNQVKYNLLDRKMDRNHTISEAKDRGISIIAYSPLEQGLLTGKFHADPKLVQASSGPRKYLARFRQGGLDTTRPVIDAIVQLANKYQVTPSQVALNWLIMFHGETVLAIPGASKVSQAEDNIGALRFQLSDEDLAILNEVSLKLSKQISE